jgi:hypothetical protein
MVFCKLLSNIFMMEGHPCWTLIAVRKAHSGQVAQILFNIFSFYLGFLQWSWNICDLQSPIGFTVFFSFVRYQTFTVIIDDFEKVSSQLKVPSISIQLFVEGNWVMPCYSLQFSPIGFVYYSSSSFLVR